ncbi:hypothetical protein I79_007417 [Cricetulus griseus]|uniref:Uncharacterized protein n=1 Tax=Cricetulus griseus TaxID=10029 RepID=G3HAG6_CRIGR|nr:hypothetical protein I79_007417 [Cricetulus griseus]
MNFSFVFGEEVFVQSNTKEQMIFHRYPVLRGPVLICLSVGYTGVWGMLSHSSCYLMLSPQKFELEPQSHQEHLTSFCQTTVSYWKMLELRSLI